MFKSLAEAVMAGRAQAVTLALLFAVLAAFLPPFSLMSGAVVGLVALRLGLRRGGEVLLLGTAALLGLGALMDSPLAGVSYGLSQWLPVLLLAGALRASGSWALTALLGVALGTLGILLAHLLVPDLSGWWQGLLERLLEPMLAQSGEEAEALRTALPRVAGLMTGMLAVSVLLNALLALMLGRWWQALLYNPGGFGSEFRAWRLPAWYALLSLLVLAGGALSGMDVLTETGLLLLAPFFFQGIAVMHGLSHALSWPGVALWALYALLILALPQMAAMLTAMGVIDAFADFRRRVAPQDPGAGRRN